MEFSLISRWGYFQLKKTFFLFKIYFISGPILIIFEPFFIFGSQKAKTIEKFRLNKKD